MPRPTLDDLRSLLLDPRSDPLDVGLALHALTPEDLRELGFASLRELVDGPVVSGP